MLGNRAVNSARHLQTPQTMKTLLLLITAVILSISECQAQSWTLSCSNPDFTSGMVGYQSSGQSVSWRFGNADGQANFDSEYDWTGSPVSFVLPATDSSGNPWDGSPLELVPVDGGVPTPMNIDLSTQPAGGNFDVGYPSGALTVASVPEPTNVFFCLEGMLALMILRTLLRRALPRLSMVRTTQRGSGKDSASAFSSALRSGGYRF